MALSAAMTTTAAAPSLIPEAFPAVTVPPSFLKAGGSLAIFSSDVSIGRSSTSKIGAPLLLGDDDRDDLIGHGAARDGGPGTLVAHQGQFVLLLPGDAVPGGDVLGGDPHVIAVEDLVEAVEDHQVGDLPVGHAHPVPPAGIGQGEGGVRHVLHAARDDDLRIACLDGLGGQGDRLHARGADLVDGEGVGLLGEPRIDACLRPGFCPRPAWRTLPMMHSSK